MLAPTRHPTGGENGEAYSKRVKPVEFTSSNLKKRMGRPPGSVNRPILIPPTQGQPLIRGLFSGRTEGPERVSATPDLQVRGGPSEQLAQDVLATRTNTPEPTQEVDMEDLC